MTISQWTEKVAEALGMTGEYQYSTIQPYVEDILSFIKKSGVSESDITVGIVARGVTDLWNYGSGEGKLSSYFCQRISQLSL